MTQLKSYTIRLNMNQFVYFVLNLKHQLILTITHNVKTVKSEIRLKRSDFFCCCDNYYYAYFVVTFF